MRVFFLLLLAVPVVLAAPEAVADDAWTTRPGAGAWQQGPGDDAPRLTRSKWGLRGQALYFRQFDSGLGSNGSFSADRVISRLSVIYRVKPKIPLTLSFGYRYDGYDFSGPATPTFPADPWTHIHSPRLSLPLFVPISQRWFALAILTARSTFESGARFEDGITGGGIFGVSYKVNNCLSVGPGIGVITELEDDPSIFPFLLIDWKIRRNLTLKTGQGVGATQGPGLFLEYAPNRCWTLSAGGRFERLRFRLDDRGVAPGGIGEDSSWAAVASAEWKPTRRLALVATLGASFGGRLAIETANGTGLFKKNYDPSVLAGFGIRFEL